MKRIVSLPLIVAAVARSSPAAAQESPYAGYADRAIKALAPEEIEGFLRGDGMRMALPAELNGYPGPRHALELADSLGLSPDQRMQARAALDEMRAAAVALGGLIVEQEAALDSLFRTGVADSGAVARLTRAIGEDLGRLRAVHLLAHLRLRAILTPAQAAAYDRLRGYTRGDGASHRHIHE
jgi:Spy/CpxP family protein refolding chaperone